MILFGYFMIVMLLISLGINISNGGMGLGDTISFIATFILALNAIGVI